MPTIFDYVNSREIAKYITANPTMKVPYLGSTLFPARKQLGLDISWIKGSMGLPVALTLSAFDAKATLRDRVGFDKVETEMPFFREAMRVGEKDRQEINKLLASGNAQYIMPLLNNIYDDAGKLIDGAEVQSERMRMQLLATGKISINANRQLLDYDYKLPSGNKETLLDTDRWSDTANSKPLADIQRWMDAVETATGTRPTRAICTRKTFTYLLQNASIKNALYPVGNAGANVILTEAQVKQYIASLLSLNIAIYTKMYIKEDGTQAQFFPDEVFTLIPDGNLGSTFFGTTPEESDLMSGNTDAQVSIVNTGIAVTTIKEAHPVNVMTVVSGIMLPSFEQIDSTFIATVA